MKLAIYTSDYAKNDKLIKDIHSFLANKYNDTFICTSSYNDTYSHYAVLQPFYLRFFDGVTVFLTVEDYIEYKDKIISNKILYVDDTVLHSKLDKSMLKDCEFLVYDQNKQLNMVNNYVIR